MPCRRAAGHANAAALILAQRTAVPQENRDLLSRVQTPAERTGKLEPRYLITQTLQQLISPRSSEKNVRFSSKEVDRYYLKMPILAAINQKVPNLKPRLKFEPTKIEKVLSENRTQKRRLLAEIEGILEEHKTTSNLSEVEIRLLIAKNENVTDRVHRRNAL